ncbi:MAG: beta-glucosidase, partial [Treponema sp.]|nr:beta-glucosidase [Treponema sp.]
MKKIIIPLLITLLLIISCRSGKSITGSERIIWDSQTPLEEVVAQMTLSEKIGQMTQAERSDIYISDISKYALGSILSGGGSVPSNNTQNGWTKMIGDFTEESLNTRAGIPVIYGIDAVHGHNNVLNAVITPHNIALGAIAAGDMEKGVQAAYNAAQITAQEMKATGIFWTFAPVLGIAEDVRWGRTYECYSEDVNIVTALGTSTVKGLQEGGVAACIKHYIGEGQTVNGRNQGNAVLDRNNIERLLIPYRAAIDAGAMSLMASFSSVNNIKMHEHKELLTDILKGELGFQGMILSDWAAIEQLSGRTYKAQIANAINAGIDMVMATNGREKWTGFIRNLHQLVEEGTVPMSRIDDAVIRILRFKQSAGILNMRSLRNLHGSSETHNALTEQTDTIGSNKNRQTARSIVSDSLVLLRNENNV